MEILYGLSISTFIRGLDRATHGLVKIGVTTTMNVQSLQVAKRCNSGIICDVSSVPWGILINANK